ncbi:hypothetical protein PM082_009479 [Marasmius tenuissimus]|nr:hypothetical protein PM082_009479 [Marasmius tenuissimus]
MRHLSGGIAGGVAAHMWSTDLPSDDLEDTQTLRVYYEEGAPQYLSEWEPH